MSKSIDAWMLTRYGKPVTYAPIYVSSNQLRDYGCQLIPAEDYAAMRSNSERWRFAKKHFGYSIVRVKVKHD